MQEEFRALKREVLADGDVDLIKALNNLSVRYRALGREEEAAALKKELEVQRAINAAP